jgi:glycosyltransferase involved in cell wall biosynthesis
VKVCIFGTFDARRHPRVQVLDEGLVANGFDVVRCNVPWRASTSERVAASRRPDVAVRLLARLIVAWFGVWRRARRCRDVEVVVVGYLGVLDVHLARWCFPRARLVLDHLAPVGGTMEDRGRRGLVGKLAGAVDRAAVRRASLVIVDTEEHAALLPPGRSVVVPVGAPARWFEANAARDGHRDGHPEAALTVVFFGLYTPLQGAPVIAHAVGLALDRGARLQVDMVGHGQDLSQARRWLRDRPEVRWHRWVEPDDLPAFVARRDLCLGIFGATGKAARVVPNKVFQGAAAGCAIVTSDTPPQRRAFGDAAIYVPAGDARALADVLVSLAADHDEVVRARQATADLARRDWRPEQVVAPLVDRLRPGAS